MVIGVIGSITKDRIIIDQTNDQFDHVGGTVYYSSLTLAHLGCSVISIPLLAEKDSYLLKHFKHENIACYPAWTERTTEYENRYPSDSYDICERTIIAHASDFSLTNTILKNLSVCSAIHLGPLAHDEFSPDTFTKLREHVSGIIGFDAQGFLSGEEEYFNEVVQGTIDIIKLSSHELLSITKETDEAMAVEKLIGLGIHEIVVTRGSQGSTICYNQERIDLPASKPQQIIDATGCGDTYFAAYLLKRTEGYSREDSGKYASRIAAEKLAYRGPIKDEK